MGFKQKECTKRGALFSASSLHERLPFSPELIEPSSHSKWAHLGSNQGPTGYEPVALPAELWARPPQLTIIVYPLGVSTLIPFPISECGFRILIPHSAIYNPHLISGFDKAFQLFRPAGMS